MNLFRSPVFYLVGSNLLFWGVPLVLVHLRSPQLSEMPLTEALRPDLPEVNVPLPASTAALSQVRAPMVAVPALSEADPGPARAVLPSEPPPLEPSEPLDLEPPSVLITELKGAAGLGGPITLQSLEEPLMPIAARVERQQQQRSGDALAALPRHWRESLRQELPATQSVSEAAVVRLPVPALKRRQEVPVIVNEHGEGEALVAPRDQLVRQAVEDWAARQIAASAGTVQVYVVAAEPLPPD